MGDVPDDLYRVLGVEPAASRQEIAAAYRRLLRSCHPDRLPPGTSEDERRRHGRRLQDGMRAYQVLSDPQRRAEYDNEREAAYLLAMTLTPSGAVRIPVRVRATHGGPPEAAPTRPGVGQPLGGRVSAEYLDAFLRAYFG
ncbi:MAG: chaperone protein DnaJ [Micrococcaceae bacterium]|nr:chaperone protein DnaJ [Micrococcaceae bacterium]